MAAEASAALAAAKKTHREASEQWERAQERRTTLGRVKAAQPLRSFLERQDTARQRRDEERRHVADESDGLQDAREASLEAGKKLDAADLWLKNHPHALSGSWEHLRTALLEHAQASSAEVKAAGQLPKLQEAASQAAKALKLATTKTDTAESRLEQCQSAVDRAEAAIPEGRLEGLEAQRAIGERRREGVQKAEKALADVQSAQTARQRAENAADEARKKQQAALETVEHTRAALHDHGVRLEEADRALEASQAIRELENRRSDLVEGEPCPLCGSPSHPFLDDLEDGAPLDVLAEQRQRLQKLRAHGKKLTADLATGEQQARTSEAEAKAQTEEVVQALAQLAAPQRSWAQVLDMVLEIGLPEIDLPLDPFSEEAARAVEQAVATTQRAMKDLTRQEQELKALERDAKETRRDRDAARRLEHDTAWCDTESHALDQVQQTVQSTESVLTERRERREEHERTDRPETSEEEATTQKKIAVEEHRVAEEKAQEQILRIRQDDAARARGDALATAIAGQEDRSKRWAMLNEVIGSHDGHKFRKFAQGLTLSSLLGYANAHLRDLAPRYYLDRVPEEDLELQVIDRDMGDEIRSINSLSGGETFLASLALALGLSSLSASDTPVESLFIDEGFGTLDLNTLETALSALDALQASGRQVGIISHVQELDQRIGAQVRVVKLGSGRSRVETSSGF